jgi:hypothetical protein
VKKEKMDKTKIAFGIGVVVTVLAIFTASAVAQNIVYFDPDPSSAGPGDTITVTLWLNTTEGVANMNDDIYFGPTVVNITSVTAGDFPTMFGWVHHGDWVRIGGTSPNWLNQEGLLKLADFTLEGIGSGVSTLDHVGNGVYDEMGNPVSATWYKGTFTCTAPPETFNKPLDAGWNLISLPLTATDMTVSNVMASLTYDELYKYDASMNSYAPMGLSDTMANGVGYFINITIPSDTWTYSGTAYMSMNDGYFDGLNMIGWLNCTKDISTTGLDDPAKTYYISRWNATKQEYETYNPVAPDPYTSGGFNKFFEMVRGEGYFISMKTGGTLSESC